MRAGNRLILASFLLLGASMTPAVRGLEPSPSDPEKWTADMAAFATADADNPPPPRPVVFVGSSSIRLWDLKKSFPDLVALNRGFGGSQIADATRFADVLVVKYNPRLIVFYAGDNDVNAGKSAEQVHVDFQAFAATVRKSLPATPIVFLSIKPSLARWDQRDTQRAANRLIAADCAHDKLLQFVDVWPAMLGDDGAPKQDLFVEDGLHLSDAGYSLWAELLRPLVADESPDKQP
jgi:lysophospholipase L1-like esterase